MVIAYLLSSTIVAPLYGKLADIHGRRGMMMVALGLFVAGSVLCAVAPDMATLIAGRTLQGIGGGGIVPMVQITVADMVTPRERGRYQAYMGTAWITAGVVGPALGGIIAQNWHWSLIFWLNVPLGLLTAALLNQSMKRLPPAGRKHKLDFLGVALVMAAATLFLLALTTGGMRVPWLSPTIFALIGASILLTIVVGWWLKRAPEPFLPLNVLANPVMKLGTAATSFSMGVMTGFMIYMPLYFQTVHKLTPTQAGLCLIPVIVMTTPGSMASGRAMMHLNRYKISPYVGMVLATLAVATLVVWPDMPVLWAVVATAVVGYGVGTRVPDRHRLRAERGVAARGRHRDRRDELLPRADLGARGRDHGRDPAGGARLRAGARRRRCRGAGGECRRQRSRRRGRVPVGVRRRAGILGARARRASS